VNNKNVSIFRRLGAIIYDLLIVLSILLFATAILLPLNHGNAFKANNVWYQLYLFSLIFFFYIGFWTWKGQTLGMVAWKIRIESVDGTSVSLFSAVTRFFFGLISFGIAGLGFLWMLFDKDRMTVYDRISKTKLVCLSD